MLEIKKIINEKCKNITSKQTRDVISYLFISFFFLTNELPFPFRQQNERCNYSQCSGGYTKCGVCQGRGHNTNNKITSTCSSCKGQGRHLCNSCKGTQKKYPNGPSLPSVPRARQMESIPTFGYMPDYSSQI